MAEDSAIDHRLFSTRKSSAERRIAGNLAEATGRRSRRRDIDFAVASWGRLSEAKVPLLPLLLRFVAEWRWSISGWAMVSFRKLRLPARQTTSLAVSGSRTGMDFARLQALTNQHWATHPCSDETIAPLHLVWEISHRKLAFPWPLQREQALARRVLIRASNIDMHVHRIPARANDAGQNEPQLALHRPSRPISKLTRPRCSAIA